MNALLLLTLLPLVVVNAWHAWLLVRHPKADRPLTISEHAVTSGRRLVIHQIIHAFPLPIFTLFAIYYLWPAGYKVAAVLFVAGAVFDVAEILTLNKETAPVDSKLNPHFVTAWFMTASYMLYAVIISTIAAVSIYVYGPILAVCMCLLVFAVTSTFRRSFLLMQMLFFVLLSSVVFIAHLKLLLS